MELAVETISIGASDLRVVPLGVGTWAWGDRFFWGYGQGYNQSDIVAAFQASLKAGIRLFDTAEIYGMGISERILGQLSRTTENKIVIASKFMPFPWRLSARSLRGALRASLQRLGIDRIDLYQIHWPTPLLGIPQLMEALADAVAEGLVRYVGVSNYSADQTRRAHRALARRGVPLISNQVQYSLLHRAPEVDGVQATCHDLGIMLIAYSPLAMGVLTGKYTPSTTPGGARRMYGHFRAGNLAAAQPVIALLRQIGTAHGGKSPGQVALNWLIQRGALPIPGAKNVGQATENTGALGWALDESEVELLDTATRAWRRG
jgi:aryl-alcohol dehydrogenase-like predicted oxidoreductase